MMRSDMPKQIMAYRNGGGIPSLATAPMNTVIGGEPHQLSYITPFEAELLRGMGGSGSPGPGGVPQYKGVYESLFGKPFSDTRVGQALGMQHSGTPPGFSPAEDAAMAGPTQAEKLQKFLDDTAAAAKERGDKTRAAKAAADAANTSADNTSAATTAASDSSAALEAAKESLAATQGSDLAKDASIVTMLNNRDDLSILEKIEFAEQLAGDFGLTDSQGVAAAKALASNAALDISSNLSAAERLELLQAAGVTEPGLIASFETAAAAETGAAAPGPTTGAATPGPATGAATPGPATPGPAPAADNSAATIAGLEASLAQSNQQAATQIANLQAQINALTAAQNTSTGTTYGSYPGVSSVLPGTTNIDYGSSIIPNPNVTTAGIAGLPSTGTSPTSSFTAYLPPIQPVSISPLTLPSLI